MQKLLRRSATATLTWLLLLLAATPARPQAKLEIPGGFGFDFGDVYAFDVRRVLPILNTGKDTLKLSAVSASCGCTAALISKSNIAPGDTGFLSITFNARGFEGKVKKTVSMQSNDKDHRYIDISFGANVITTLLFDPEYLYYTATVDSPEVKTLTISNASSAPITVLSVTPPTSALSITIDKPTIPPSGAATLTATLRAPSPGIHRGDIQILTDHPVNPGYTLRFFALAKPRMATR